MKEIKPITGYALVNIDHLVGDFFYLRRDAVKAAKYNVSNHPGLNWKDIYTIVKVETRVLKG